MKNAFLSLPGPIPIKVVLAVVIVLVALVILHFVYDWMGNALDSGGSIG